MKDINDKIDHTEKILSWYKHFAARSRTLDQISGLEVYFDFFGDLKTDLGPTLVTNNC